MHWRRLFRRVDDRRFTGGWDGWRGFGMALGGRLLRPAFPRLYIGTLLRFLLFRWLLVLHVRSLKLVAPACFAHAAQQ